MKIALAPVGSEGDVRPALALALGARDRGHDVVVAAAPDFAQMFGKHGIAFREIGSSFRPVSTGLAKRINGKPMMGLGVMMSWCRSAVDEQFEQIGSVVSGCDRIVGSGLQFAASSFAEREGIPYRHVGHVPTLIPGDAHPPVIVPWQNLPRWVNRILWRVTSVGMNAMLRGAIDRRRNPMGLAGIEDFNRFFLRGLLIAMDPELGPLPQDAPLDVAQTGYWRVDDSAELPADVERFLSSGEPPIYFGFGSMGDPDPRKTSAIVLEAAALSGRRAIVSKGWAGLGGGASSDRVLEVESISHGLLFPRLAAVVHHGGAGTTWMTCRAGVPHVVVPHLLDQYWWADRLAKLGVSGGTVQRRGLDSRSLAEAIGRALDPSRSAKLASLSQSLTARNGVAQACGILQE